MSKKTPTFAPAHAPRSPAIFVGRACDLERFAEAMGQLRLALVYGVSGAGKTAFMLRAAEELAAKHNALLLYHRCRSGDSVAAMVRVVSAQAPPRPCPPAADPVEQLAALADAGPLVLCLDNAERLDDRALLDAAAYLAGRRLPLWLCIAAREALDISPLTVDHLVVRLGSLSSDDSQLLWTTLQRLYGPPEGARDVDATLARGQTPLSLKRIFAGPGVSEEDILGLDELPPAARQLLTRVSAFRHPVPLAALVDSDNETDAEGAPAALRELARRFLVESGAPEAITLHDAVREAVMRSRDAPGKAEHLRALGWYRRQSTLQPGSDDLETEILFHAVAADEIEVALTILRDHASIFRRFPPGSSVVDRELAHAADTLAARLPLDEPIRRLRERIRARQGQVEQAFDAMRALSGSDPAVDYDLADMAFSLGRFDEALVLATRAAEQPELHPFMRALAVAVVAEVHRHRGALDEAEATLKRAAPLFAQFGAVGVAVQACTRAIWAHDFQRYGEAAQLVADGRRALAELGIPVGLPLVASLERAIGAALGHGRRGDDRSGEIYDETIFFRHVARLLHAEELLFAGEAQRASELADETRASALTRGFRAVAGWGDWLWGHAEIVLGQPRDLLKWIEAALDEAESAGYARTAAYLDATLARGLLLHGDLTRAQGIIERAEARCGRDTGLRARLLADRSAIAWLTGNATHARTQLAVDLAAEGYDRAELALSRCEARLWDGQLSDALAEARALVASCHQAGWRWHAQRARLLAAEAELRIGEVRTAAAAVTLLRQDLERDGYGVERARAALLAAVLARTSGDSDGAAAILVDARDCAATAGLAIEAEAATVALAVQRADTPGGRLAHRLHLDAAGTLRLREPGETRVLTPTQAGEWRWDRYEVVIDKVERLVRIGERVIKLASRERLFEIVSVLAMRPNEVFSASELTQAAWQFEYHPVRHHSRLTTMVSRLRPLLGAELLEGSRAGYRLILPARWAVLEPL